ncbi:hypothetical protein MBSD_n0751 [Mizugakiibacter sediminis]|uniref:Membrane protein n=1 Tax=Mizugakiibacter sediminis TaxID=1475481 RepID=A0A0K8QL76_9GAMM|nr:DUF6116 family protein [Mizugakiibacter sediminis]GAP65461.1 hypothetical protein MBSD_n0751 [Mizugakiibacter sediminis]
MPRPLVRRLLGFAGRLRHPQLFVLIAALFVFDLLLPDPVPFVDEILLGLLTLALGRQRMRADRP